MDITYILCIICLAIQGYILKSMYDDWKFERAYNRMVQEFCDKALISCDKMLDSCDRIQNVVKDGEVWIDTE